MKYTFTFVLCMTCIMIFGQNSPGTYTVKNAKINTEDSDFGTAFYGNDKVVFASPKQGFTFNREEHNSQPFLDLYVGEVTEDGQIIKKQKLPGDINSKYHEGVVCFTKDMKTVYFSANNYVKKKKNKEKHKVTSYINLFTANINEAGEWTHIKMLPFNGTNFSTGHPVLNRDDTKLYFISDRPESFGKTDIFVVDIYEDGSFSQPRNLGRKINTPEREMFPFIGKDNVLYFSSDGYPGYGELDVFASKIFDNTVSEPINLEGPVNSEFDDFAYIIDDHKNRGYFSSNREGGSGDDDIYTFLADPPIYIECQQEIRGVVRDIDTQELIPNAEIILFDAQGTKLQSFMSSKENGAFSFQQSCNTTYTLKGYLEGYLIGEMDIKTVNDLDAKPLEITFLLRSDPDKQPEVIAEAITQEKTDPVSSDSSEEVTSTVAAAGVTNASGVQDTSDDEGESVTEAEVVVAVEEVTSTITSEPDMFNGKVPDSGISTEETVADKKLKVQTPMVAGSEVIGDSGKEDAYDDQGESVTEAEVAVAESWEQTEAAAQSEEQMAPGNDADFAQNKVVEISDTSEGQLVAKGDNLKDPTINALIAPTTNSEVEEEYMEATPAAMEVANEEEAQIGITTDSDATIAGNEEMNSSVLAKSQAASADQLLDDTVAVVPNTSSSNPELKNDSEYASGEDNKTQAQTAIAMEVSERTGYAEGETVVYPSDNVPAGNLIQINTIYFDYDKYNIRFDARIELDKIAGVLEENPQAKIKVNAHTDIRGTEAYNLKLSKSRASTTVNYLLEKGITEERITAEGHGESQVVQKCSKMNPCTGLQHQLNRRAEFLIIDKFSEAIIARSVNKEASGNYALSSKLPNSGAYVNYDFSDDREVYTVQLGAFKGDVQNDKFNKLKDLFNYRYKDGLNRYYAGIFETSAEARSYMKSMRKNGFEDAFVVGLKGTDRF